tara:strand:- start:17 stop:232 length:216 start_codon:yes stop_codon:yes gene_type:complete
MSNQRPGKMQSRPDQPGSEMSLFKFFKEARVQLEDAGHDDAAFYFEQMQDWISSGKKLPTDKDTVIRALGI